MSPPSRHRDVPSLARTGIVAFVVLGAAAAAVLWYTLPPPAAVVNVRWEEGVTEAERVALETKFLLTQGHIVERTTWQYALLDYSPENIRAIVDHPDVEDTHGLDRVLYRPSEPPLDRNWRVAGGALSVGAAGAVLLLAWRLRPSLLLVQPARTATANVPATWKIVALAGVTMLCWSSIFAPTYTRSFYWDDLHFIRPYSLSEIVSTFHGPNDPDDIETVALRPIATMLFCLQGTVLGEHVVLQRLFMAALMGGLLVATGLLLREAGLSLSHIVVVFALFASSRVFASLVLWITLGTVILSYIFMMLSALCYLRWIARQGGRLLFLTVGLAALAIFTREEAYTLPVVLPLVWVLARRPGHWRRALAGAAAVGVVMAVHVLLRQAFLPDAPPVQVSWESLTRRFWPSLQSAWLPGGLRALGFVDPLLRNLWQGFLGALILVFAFVGTSRTHRAVLGLCVLALVLCTPSLGVARSFGIAMPSLAFFTAISVAIIEVRGIVFPTGYAQRLLRPAVSILLALGLALGIGAGLRRSWYVAEAQHENSVERVIRDGSFLFDLYSRPATIPAKRRDAGLERLAAVGIRSPEDLRRLQNLGNDEETTLSLERSGSPLFVSKYDDSSF